MKSWLISTKNAILLYCSFLFIESLTSPHLPFHFLSNWPPNSNFKKGKIWKVSPYLTSSLPVFYLGYTCFNFLHFSFLIIWKDLRELLLVLVIFAPQQKKSKKTKRRYKLMIESLLSSNTSNRFKFIVTPTRGKNLGPPSQKWNYDSYLQENQGL